MIYILIFMLYADRGGYGTRAVSLATGNVKFHGSALCESAGKKMKAHFGSEVRVMYLCVPSDAKR